ncbi:nucleoside deaminase [Glutamicibacter nicotianae]|uniref:nucleoside deaminase n=1 Tax=Glutamicibacter nicotianae TaxID=37929 RepID=UPI00195AF105|nr:nucleoside deaminase [Glutamicibacter nicotianae]MBM7769479.1 cytosine deaminase [Glutamicibacter nicotianae]
MNQEMIDEAGYEAALQAARTGAAEGGVPIGSSLAGAKGVIATGHNRRVQQSDPTGHAEIDALRSAGRRTSYRDLTLYTTLAPCALCSGAIVLFKIPRVVVGEAHTFGGEIAWLRERGVQVEVLQDERAQALMERFISEHPEIWNEDIAEEPAGS